VLDLNTVHELAACDEYKYNEQTYWGGGHRARMGKMRKEEYIQFLLENLKRSDYF
jgi:hypothetical protein